MTTAPMIRLHLFFAAENDRAVILRQGPAKHCRMILWHRDNDRFEDGQWLLHKVYVERCDLSPDGQHFLFFALDARWQSEAKGSYTAISRPPYWTALALYPQGDSWGGGGCFVDNAHVFASGGQDIIGRVEGVSRVEFGKVTKDCRTGLRLQSGTRAPIDRAATKRLLADPVPEALPEMYRRLPVPRLHALDRYDTVGGKLYRRHGMELELIRDFTDMAFEPIRAPYDWREPGQDADPTPWHPLDGELR